MKLRGFALTLMMVAIALAKVSTTYATAPVISDPGDVIIGDLEDRSGTTPNVFVSPDAIDADAIVSDDVTPDNQIKWSFTQVGTGNAIRINGLAALPNLIGLDDNDPTSPNLTKRLDQNNSDAGGPVDLADGNARTFTVRDQTLSPNNSSVNGSPDGLLNTSTITLFASDCSTFGQRTIAVFTIKGESDSLSGGGPEIVKTVDFTTTTDGWIGGNTQGATGTVSSGASGLCMTVGTTGTNIVLWLSPEGYIELVDNAVYRVRTNVSTTQTTADAIPLWFFLFTNSYYLSDPNNGGNYGGFAWVLDVDGGAQGIGRAQGRTSYDFWYTPNAVATPQWSAGAYTVAADALNDTVLEFEIIDANASLLTDADSGTICIEDIEVGRLDRGSIQVASTPLSAPLNTSTHFAAVAFGAGSTASINNGTAEATVDMGTTGDIRVNVGYFNASESNLNRQLFPVIWEADTLYRTRMAVRAQSSAADQADAIFVAMDVTNSELGMQSYTLRSGGSVMNGAASPQLASAEYEAYFYSQNATSSVTPDAGRLRPAPFFFNTTTLFGNGNGGDALVVESIEVDKLNN